MGKGVWANLSGELSRTQPCLDILGPGFERLAGEEGSHLL